MKSQIFINLPVKDLDKSFSFYSKMGFSNNPQFSDETAKCMVFSDEIFVMIMTHDKFKSFVNKPITDVSKTITLLLSISVDSLDKVNEICNNALTAGGIEPVEAKDYGFMQQRTIEDPDGHTWEIFNMDMSKFPQQ
ncbi:MAG: glyoxalase/bleomycin resistance/extradiol dioxygenase family protein [Bacteroidia bacterium]|nr:glyoxalase/bleomycin resistance/extradiol dioxygenase family protein [Bacteroidia bacterium]